MTHASGAHTDQSSASSYFLLPLMLLVLCVSHLVQRRERRWAVAACTAFIACYWIYGFVGVPIWLAKYTLWGNMPTFRMDVGMGLVSVVLITLAAEKGCWPINQRPVGGRAGLCRHWLLSAAQW